MDQEKAKEIGQNVQNRRQLVAMSQDRLAALSFCDAEDIGRYEAGEDIPASVLYWIARALSVSADRLLGIE